MNRFLLFFLFLISAKVSASSVVLFNDSPFILKATVISADGETLGTFTIYPQRQTTWQDSYLGTSQFSQTPYTVIWTCKDGNEFGINYQVATGGMATPLSSSGRRYCKPEKKREPRIPQRR
ncbi:MAG: hypothetical protein Tsb0015_16280 [Simkaniaceae bacterium]